tara:strand:- start:145 stop:720 length:576 start_codon:yes stop_codon:yes gene_type:complete
MDYRFAIKCWQDQAGSENAKANVFLNGAQVLTEVEVAKTSSDDASLLIWESTGLDEPDKDSPPTVDIKVVLANEYYVDENTDRNIHIDGIGYIDKRPDGNYTINPADGEVADGDGNVQFENVTDFTNWAKYKRDCVPTAVVGDQIADDFWSGRDDTTDWCTITVWGGDDTGVTITHPLKGKAKHYIPVTHG